MKPPSQGLAGPPDECLSAGSGTLPDVCSVGPGGENGGSNGSKFNDSGGIPMFMKPQTALVVSLSITIQNSSFFFGSKILLKFRTLQTPDPHFRTRSFCSGTIFQPHSPCPARWPGSCWRSASVSWASRSTQRSSYKKCSATTRACASCASKSP